MIKQHIKLKTILIFTLIFVTALAMMPQTVGAVSGEREDPKAYNGAVETAKKQAAMMSSNSRQVSSYVGKDGKLTLKWQKISDVDGYILTRTGYNDEYKKVQEKEIYKGAKTYFKEKASTLHRGYTYQYNVKGYRSTDAEDGEAVGDNNVYTEVFSMYKYSSAIPYVSPTKLYFKNKRVTVNKGKTRQLRIAFSSPDVLKYYDKECLGRWYSSNENVAVVSQSGKLTAKKTGWTTVTFKAINGKSVKCSVNVTDGKAMGSAYIKARSEQHMTTILGNLTMKKNSQNRLNGTIISDYKLKKITVSLCSSKGKMIKRYTKKTNAKSYNLSKLSKNVPFNTLSKGTKMVKVIVKNSKGITTVYQEKFKVSGAPSKKNKGTAVAKWAQTRLGDPYSQGKRGSSNYTDCSYLTIWAFKQVANISLPRTAADQYKYCVKRHRSIKKSQLRAGDLIFWGGAKNGRYKGIDHVEIYLGDGHSVGAIYVGVSIRDFEHYTPSSNKTKLYYGRVI